MVSDFGFHAISREQMDEISPSFIDTFVLAKSRLRLLPVIFHEFETKLWSLVDVFYSMKSTTRYGFSQIF